MNDHPDVHHLRRQILIAQLACLALAIWGLVWIWLSLDIYKGVSLILGIGLLFFALGIMGVVFTPHRKRQLLSAYERSTPVPGILKMNVQAWSDSTDYEGILKLSEQQNSTWKIVFSAPSWDFKIIADRLVECQVYRDSNKGFPLVIEVKGKLLWTIGNPRRE